MASIWIPLNYPEPVDLSQQTIFPDITVNNIYELRSFLAVDDDTPISTIRSNPSISMDVDDEDDIATQNNTMTNGSKSNGNNLTTIKSLKKKSFRGASTVSACSSSSSMVNGCLPATGCFSSSKNKVNASSSAVYPRRFLSPPDLDNNNSNASDGS
jgi:hypothetical protein